jgi:hypothetical protein
MFQFQKAVTGFELLGHKIRGNQGRQVHE